MTFWQSKTKIRRTDQLFSQYIRQRDGECVYKVKCYGHQDIKELHCSHFHGRARESTRFDPENCDSACRTCHAFVHTADGIRWLEQFKKKQLGERNFNLLTLRANTPSKRDDTIMLLYVKQLLKDLKTPVTEA